MSEADTETDCVEFFQELMMEGNVATDPYGNKSLVHVLPDEHLAFLAVRGNTLTCTVADPRNNRLLSISINAGDGNSQAAWNHIHELQTLALLKKSPGKAPKGNWCAVAVHQLTPILECSWWLEDFENSLIWTWLTWSSEHKENFRKRLGSVDHQMEALL